MAAWTQADADKLSAAIISLASGEAVLSVSYNGPPARTITYQQRDLKQMRDLLAQVNASIARQAGGKTYRLAGFRKGV